ncbi:MAG: MMPL family transporter [Planctomycetota bacterium]
MNICKHIVVRSYDFWHTRRWALLSVVVLIFLAMGLYCLTLSFSSDIRSMLPDKDGHFREDFELFSYAPFSRNILISLEVTNPNGPEGVLEEAADRITGQLKPPYFQQVVCGISQEQKIQLFAWIYEHFPCLANNADIKSIKEKIAPAAIQRQLQENIRILHSPESVILKDFLLQDPLAFRELLLGKLQQLNLVSGFSAESDYFLSADSRHLLIVAETDVSITDYKGSRELLDALYATLDEYVPEGVGCSVISGHRYTVANAETIQSDLRRVLAVSVTGLLIIFILFLRHWRAAIVFLVPLAALLTGITAAGLCFPKVSSITVGFGAVLLGISADFGLHVFFGLQKKDIDTRQTLSDLTKPLSFCALTTIGVFSVLLFSALPGQRQLAVFSISGIFAAFVLSLFVMPHFLPEKPVLSLRKLSLPHARRSAVFVWLCIFLVSLVPASQVEFDGTLRSIGMIPDEVLSDELQIRSTWGGIRDQALLFSVGQTEEEALQKNDDLFRLLKSQNADLSFLSLATLVPSLETQKENLARWDNFWNKKEQKQILLKDLEEGGRFCGFTSDAFEPFFTWLGRPPQPFTPDKFAREGNDKMASPFMARLKDGQYAVLTFIPDEDSVFSLLGGADLDVKVVSNRKFSDRLNDETVRDFTRFFGGSVVIIMILLLLLFRDFKKVLLAFVPVLVGLVIMAAAVSALGMKINLFNMVASILVIGLSVDYGIFIVCSVEAESDDAIRNAVLVSGLTTCVGFGSLMLACHPSMHSIGTTVAAGIVPSLLCALTLLPYLSYWLLKKRRSNEHTC